MAKYLVQVYNGDQVDVHGWKRIEAATPEYAVRDYLRANRPASGMVAVRLFAWRVGEQTHPNGNPVVIHGFDVSIRPVQRKEG